MKDGVFLFNFLFPHLFPSPFCDVDVAVGESGRVRALPCISAIRDRIVKHALNDLP